MLFYSSEFRYLHYLIVWFKPPWIRRVFGDAEEFLMMWNITLHCYTDTVILTCAQKYHNNSISVRQWKLITRLFTSKSPKNEHWRNEKWIIHYFLFLGPPYDSYDDCCNTFNSAPNASLYIARGWLSTVSTVDSTSSSVWSGWEGEQLSPIWADRQQLFSQAAVTWARSTGPLMLIIFIGRVRHHHL